MLLDIFDDLILINCKWFVIILFLLLFLFLNIFVFFVLVFKKERICIDFNKKVKNKFVFFFLLEI